MVNNMEPNIDIMRVEIPEDGEGIHTNGLREAAMELEDYKESVGLNGNTEYLVGYESTDPDPSTAFNKVPLTGSVIAVDKEETVEDPEEYRQVPLATVLRGYSDALNEVEQVAGDLEEESMTVTQIHGVTRDESLLDAVERLERYTPSIELNIVGQPVNLRYSSNKDYFEIVEDWQHERERRVNLSRYEEIIAPHTEHEVRHVPDEEKNVSLQDLRSMLSEDLSQIEVEAGEEQQETDRNLQTDF